jgi:hypothetical protein
MRDVTQIVAQLREELAGELRERVRRRLGEQPTEWLVDQLMALVLPSEEVSYAIPRQVPRGPEAGEGTYAPPTGTGEVLSGAGRGRDHVPDDPYPEGSRGDDQAPCRDDEDERAARIHRLGLDHASLPGYTARYRALRREVLEEEGHLLDPPRKGGALISPAHRSPAGEGLLREAKDLLYALLFCGDDDGVRLDRGERELLTLTVPKAKAHAVVSLMRAATEIGVEGTWRDPGRAADDDRAANALFQVEYGEVAGELVGNALGAALCLINDLEINERVLYGRMENVEESTLDP